MKEIFILDKTLKRIQNPFKAVENLAQQANLKGQFNFSKL